MKFIKDTIINIISNLLIIVVVQLVTFPLFNQNENENTFAIIIVLYGVAILLATTLGNTLNNVRLLYNDDLNIQQKNNLFDKIFLVLLTINCIVFICIEFYYGAVLNENFFLLLIFSCLLTSRYYMNVTFRENLNYRKIFILNLCVLLGYIIGILVYLFIINTYSIAFVTGELFGFLYLLKNYEFKIDKSEIVQKNKLKEIKKDLYNFISINLIINILNYLDRFILLPIIGPAAVTVYFIGSTVSKMLSLITTPVNNVILSYLTVGKNNTKHFFLLNICILIGFIPFYFIVKYSSMFLIKILYNNYYQDVYEVIGLITLICLLSIYNSILNPFVMKIISSSIIFKIQIIYGLIYLITAVLGSYYFDLTGFCIATILSMIIKLIITNILIYKRYNLIKEAL